MIRTLTSELVFCVALTKKDICPWAACRIKHDPDELVLALLSSLADSKSGAQAQTDHGEKDLDPQGFGWIFCLGSDIPRGQWEIPERKAAHLGGMG